MQHTRYTSSEKKSAVRAWLKYFFITMVIFLVVSIIVFYFRVKHISQEIKAEQAAQVLNQIELEEKYEYVLNLEQLKTYDGSDENKPILIAIDGVLYDVSSGSRFYDEGEVYHFLAGTDATEALEWVGTGIITEKYQAVGVLVY